MRKLRDLEKLGGGKAEIKTWEAQFLDSSFFQSVYRSLIKILELVPPALLGGVTEWSKQ